MTHNNGRTPEHDAIEQTTPFDEATDLLDQDELPEQDDDLVRIDRISLPPPKTLVILIAILLSPVFGLVFGLDFALGVLVIAMAFTTWLVWDGASRFVPEQAAQLRRAAMANAVVALMALALLLVRVLG